LASEFAGRIDTHHHILPPLYMKAVGESAVGRTLVSGRAPAWTPAHSIEVMDRHGIGTAITSISAPGFVCKDPGEVVPLCRHCNEYAARMQSDYPGRFGSFASLPLPDIDASLEEIAFSLDSLKADGICLLTNYGGAYLGDRQFDPVFQELDRRAAVVFVHPTESPGACLCGLPPASLEFPFDTTRAVANLLFSGTLARHRNIRFIFSHAGGAIPFLAERLARLERRTDFAQHVPEGVLVELKRLYFDTALSANGTAMSGLLRLTSIDQVVFGSDYPHAPEETTAGSVRGLGNLGLTPEELRKVEYGNASRLLPGLNMAAIAN
jgi:6-methylsalicylate decarboxylase